MHSWQCSTKLTDNVTNKARKLSVTTAPYFLASSCYGIYYHIHGDYIQYYAEDSLFQGDCSKYHTKGSGFHIGKNALKLVFVYKNSIYLGQKRNFISLLHDCVWNRFVKIKCNVGCDIVRSIMYQSKAVIYTVL